ncbi:MAG: DEAD/DEAH box helicase [Candidatus Heimdallarchaeota archaeon]|nr:MAG: DEAD/DEAH box helicase [Candidatus Heimdallarchaeota archaeon]
MTVLEKNNSELWNRYQSALENYQEFHDREEVLTEFRTIVISKNPPIDLLTKVASHFLKFKQVEDAKKTFGRILQIDDTHRETWKQLSSLYFKLKDPRKGEFCLQKYYSLAGGNPQHLQKATQLRLASSGRLKSLPTNQELGLQTGKLIQSSSPRSIMNLADFEKYFEISRRTLPLTIKKILQFAQHQVVDYRIFNEQSGALGSSRLEILQDQKLIEFLRNKKINRLYQFQEEAIKAILDSHDVCITAPTGNGKTEGFLLPAILKIRKNKGYGVQLLLVYPMKALAKDQLRKIENYAKILNLTVKVFDGDTSHYQRKKIYADPPEILITNPDILHYHLGIGKNASRFQDLLAGLKIVILDEIHTYSGTFGSNMFFIVKRLERVVNHKLQFIGASATVANASKFVSRLLDRPIKVIECKNGKRGKLHFLILAPFSGMSTLDSMINLVNSIMGLGKILVFQDSHRSVELLYQKLGGKVRKVGIHRAGLERKIREQVETDFRDGVLDLLVATPTLELGIDIGDLDIVVTPPIAVNRAMQRIGRAGRKGQESLAIILLNSEDPISHYYLQYPERYYQDIEDVFFDPENPNVTEHQLLCASLDSPLDLSQGDFPRYVTTLRQLVNESFLNQVNASVLMPTEAGMAKARKYSIRGQTHEIQIKCGGRRIGKRAMPLAMLELYPGALYYAAGTRYRVASFHFNGMRGTAHLVKPKSSWGTTFPLSGFKPEIVDIHRNYHAFGLEVAYIEAKVLQTVWGYTLESPNGTSQHRLRDPLYYSSRSKGILFRSPILPLDTLDLDRNTQVASRHTLVHVILHASLPFIGGQLHEISGLVLLPQGYILLFDNAAGSGVCAMLCDHLQELFSRAYDILGCDCKAPEGCPRCTFLPRCSHNNTKLDKLGARSLLKSILDEVKVPLGDDYNHFAQTLH